MFDRYTIPARRVVFWARHEASQFGSSSIETEHLLLGLLKEDATLRQRFLGAPTTESVRQLIEARIPRGEEIISTSIDMPLSPECSHVFRYSEEEATQLKHEYIGTEHLLLGLLREEKGLAGTILREQGLTLAQIRGEVSK